MRKLIRERISFVSEPYNYRIKGVAGYGYNHDKTAHIAYNKLKDWAEKERAKITMVKDEYKCIFHEQITGKSLL